MDEREEDVLPSKWDGAASGGSARDDDEREVKNGSRGCNGGRDEDDDDDDEEEEAGKDVADVDAEFKVEMVGCCSNEGAVVDVDVDDALGCACAPEEEDVECDDARAYALSVVA